MEVVLADHTASTTHRPVGNSIQSCFLEHHATLGRNPGSVPGEIVGKTGAVQ